MVTRLLMSLQVRRENVGSWENDLAPSRGPFVFTWDFLGYSVQRRSGDPDAPVCNVFGFSTATTPGLEWPHSPARWGPSASTCKTPGAAHVALDSSTGVWRRCSERHDRWSI